MTRRVTFAALAITTASGAIAAYGWPHWNHLDFAEETQIGSVRVQLSVDTKSDPTRLSRLDIRVNGKRLRIPQEVIVFPSDPHLDIVRLMIGPVTCVDEATCSIAYPVELHVPYGPRHSREQGNEDCETSELHINFFADAVQSASYYVCEEADAGQWHDLYRRAGA